MEFCCEHCPIPAWPSAWLAACLSLSALQLTAALMGGLGSSVGPSIPVARLTDSPEAQTPKLLPVVHREAEGCGEVSQSQGTVILEGCVPHWGCSRAGHGVVGRVYSTIFQSQQSLSLSQTPSKVDIWPLSSNLGSQTLLVFPLNYCCDSGERM